MGTMGIPLNEEHLYTLSFADDQIVMAQDYEDLEYMTRKLIEEYNNWGLEVNIKKTKYLSIGAPQSHLNLNDGQQIERCEEYKYLGVKITADGKMDSEIRTKINQGKKATAMLNSVLWDKNISNDNKHKIYNTIVKCVVTYGCEVWQFGAALERSLLATEMNFWRRSARRSRLERIRNDRIREVMNVNHTIIDDIRAKQLIWYGHMRRMTDERIPIKVFQWTLKGRRKRGRPRRSWREGIDSEMKNRNLQEGEWEDREQWRLGIGRRRRTL